MIMNYKECIARFGSPWRMNKALAAGKLFKIESGIYAETAYVPVEAILAKKYPLAVFSGQYALHVHNLTDKSPIQYTLTTGRKTSPITDARVLQLYVPEKLLYLGVTDWSIEGHFIPIYDKERMLIEVLRYKHRLPDNLYKEVLHNYRDCVGELDFVRVWEYTEQFPKRDLILRRLEAEVL